jgi:adenosine deaminase
MLEAGLLVTLNSDDPAFFGGYINENYQAMRDHAGISDEQLAEIARNSFRAAFIDDGQRDAHIAEIDDYVRSRA